ncbi:hypothetical protein ACFWC9_35750 [Streptomyces goshikiensis]|uniref:pPIWI_RE_Y domain-containing protein n=1 Tax=Streptomyces goshikiensis TaxID=1942 RepID=UPI00369B6135
MLARALIILSRRQPPHSFALPYPSVAQSALDQIVLRCVLQEKDPSESLPALISWCRHRTVGQLPVHVPAHVVTPEARLLSPGPRTRPGPASSWRRTDRRASSSSRRRGC